MVTGYILINTAPGRIGRVFRELTQVEEIIEMYPIFGEYDIIAKTETGNFDDMGGVVVDKVRSVEGVINTKTLNSVTF